MMIAELIHSCSHERIAQAALMSIGADYFRKVDGHARRFDQTGGAFAAARVSDFARDADESQWTAIAGAMSGTDMPLLSGLRHILEPHLPPDMALARGQTYWVASRCGKLRPNADL